MSSSESENFNLPKDIIDVDILNLLVSFARRNDLELAVFGD